MAQNIVIVTTCDLEHTTKSKEPVQVDAVDSVVFALDGKEYTFEVCQKHLDEVSTIFDRFTSVARSERVKKVSPNKTSVKDIDPSVIRAWAQEQGIPVSERGRIPADVKDAYKRRAVGG